MSFSNQQVTETTYAFRGDAATLSRVLDWVKAFKTSGVEQYMNELRYIIGEHEYEAFRAAMPHDLKCAIMPVNAQMHSHEHGPERTLHVRFAYLVPVVQKALTEWIGPTDSKAEQCSG